VLHILPAVCMHIYYLMDRIRTSLLTICVKRSRVNVAAQCGADEFLALATIQGYSPLQDGGLNLSPEWNTA
jgi:hypothetical protein